MKRDIIISAKKRGEVMLKLENISKYYSTKETVTQALNKINLTFNKGEFVVITGESGSGKSTLLNVISGLDSYEDGELKINDDETSYYAQEDWEQYRKHYIGFVFQNYNIIDAYTVFQNVYIALTVQGYDKETRKERALELIDQVGLTSHKNHKASKLSGGQKQRVSIARALAKDAPIIVADEPTGNLDVATGKQIIELLKSISKDKLVIMVTHDFPAVKDYATRTIRLFDGEVVEDKTLKKADEVPIEPDKSPYHINWINLAGIAFKNILAMPKKTLLTLLVSVFIVLVFTLTYGSYVQQSSATQMTYHPYFNNNTENRIIITRVDGTMFTDQELTAFNQLDGVEAVAPHDVVFDLEANVVIYNDRFDYSYTQPVKLMHANALTNRDLKEGRLPQEELEIVVGSNTSFELGEMIEVELSNMGYRYGDMIEEDAVFTKTVEVVGISNKISTGWQEEFYLHDDLFNDPYVILAASKAFHNMNVWFEDEIVYHIPGYRLIISSDVERGTFELSNQALQNFKTSFDETVQDTITDLEFTVVSKSSFYEMRGDTPFKITESDGVEVYDSIVRIHPEDLMMFISEEAYQISLVVYDRYAFNQVDDALDRNLYHVVYPANFDDGFSQVFTVINNILQGFSSVFLLVVMYFGAYLALKNIMKSKQKDFVIMRSIGASKKDLNRISVLEMVFVMGFAFMLVVLFFIINQNLTTPIPDYLRYFSFSNYLFMLGALMILSILLALRFNKKLFSISVMNALRVE